LINTVILLSSGVSITWAHHSLLNRKFKKRIVGITITILLGIYFTALQAMEYWQASFSIWDSVCGSTFFIATGFHGMHVIVGTVFLYTRTKQLSLLSFSKNHIISLESAAWYWHFVDVVWLFLYITIYWWGNFFFSINSTFIFHIKSKRRNIK
jgi:cytochrome c oxidase subunit 3